jgi:hypothetical protein
MGEEDAGNPGIGASPSVSPGGAPARGDFFGFGQMVQEMTKAARDMQAAAQAHKEAASDHHEAAEDTRTAGVDANRNRGN